MSQLAEIDAEALVLVHLYRAQGIKLYQLKLANGSGHESVRRQAAIADLTARELHAEFGLDADELLEELAVDEAVSEVINLAGNHAYVRDYLAYTLISVRSVAVLRHDLGSVGGFAELPLGTRQPVSLPLGRQEALNFLLERGAVAVDRAQEHRVTTTTRYHRVVLTQLGEALLERFEQ